MTMISAWLELESPDQSEPPGFYIPGAISWHKRELIQLPAELDDGIVVETVTVSESLVEITIEVE